MKKILLCLCFVFAVGLLFSACGKDDTASAPKTTEKIFGSENRTINGKNVKFYAVVWGIGEGNRWKLVGNEILVTASAVADMDDSSEVHTKVFLDIDGTKYTIKEKNNEDGLEAYIDGDSMDKASAIQLAGTYNNDRHYSNPIQAGDYSATTYTITSLLGVGCELEISYQYKIVDNF